MLYQESAGLTVPWRYSVVQVLKRRVKLRDAVLDQFLNKQLDGDIFESFVSTISDNLPKEVERDVIYDSVRHMAGTLLTREALDMVSWRLAGNQQRLLAGKAVGPWTRQPLKEWVPSQIVSAQRKRNDKGDPGHLFKFRLLAGYPCGLIVIKFWSDRFARFVATNTLGFARRGPSDKSDRPARNLYHHPLELVTLRLLVLIDPVLCKHEPGFERIDCGSGLLTYNREQMAYRDRLDEAHACKFGYSRECLCHLCPRGYDDVEWCRVACHRLQYEFAPCPVCGNASAPFDYDLAGNMCVECFNFEALKNR
jgi:hypothetical protein